MGIQLLLTADPTEHTRLRRLANKAFTPRAVDRLRPRVAEIVDRLLDDASDDRLTVPYVRIDGQRSICAKGTDVERFITRGTTVCGRSARRERSISRRCASPRPTS